MIDEWPRSPYTILVAHKFWAPVCKAWPAHYRQRLPVIPVPLAPPDPDLQLDLQPMIDAVYARSKYNRSIDYAKPIVPPLPDKDAAWLAEQFKAH